MAEDPEKCWYCYSDIEKGDASEEDKKVHSWCLETCRFDVARAADMAEAYGQSLFDEGDDDDGN